MVAVVLSDTGEVAQHRYAVGGELRALAHSGQHQDVGRVDRAGRQDHLARGGHALHLAATTIVDTGCAPPLDHDPFDMGAGDDLEIGSAADGVKIRPRRAETPAPGGGHVGGTDSLSHRAVHVGIVGQTRRLRRRRKGDGERVVDARPADMDRAARAVIFVGAQLEILQLLEIGQHVREAPAFVAELAPAVIVAAGAAIVDHAVDRGGAAQHLAARRVHLAAARMALRHADVHPLEPALVHDRQQAAGRVNEDAAITPARLDQQHARTGIG